MAQITETTERNDNYATTAHAIRNGGMSNETLHKYPFPFSASINSINDVFSTASVPKKAL